MSWKLPYRSEVWKLKFAACLIPEWFYSVEQHCFPALQLPAPSGKWLYSCLSDEGVQEVLRREEPVPQQLWLWCRAVSFPLCAQGLAPFPSLTVGQDLLFCLRAATPSFQHTEHMKWHHWLSVA